MSLNAAQYSQPYREAPPTYFFHPPLEIGADQAPGQTVLIPASGPPLGGTTVFVNSSLLEAVTRREGRGLSSCRFGGELEGELGEVVPATAGSSDQIPGAPTGYPGILCEAPPVANTSAVLPLVASLHCGDVDRRQILDSGFCNAIPRNISHTVRGARLRT